ncbi:RNA polymerase sigma factor [Haliangium ochraceum]|uniref:RNA polymerase, sigma-24 subunit, ECF subfamily n=1 Tax=Haliangium ochraceum (strain DSM 14365 / JCM 11303 / SMP-2) TaxID=502025 RepID=D0LIW7_HALO1|nr:RNA polymerase sigma factor [Haliangium ochraceum]ACY12996.1 RNA polymerase, sigma-24 subunit, ECF subfamily [Haliangium ochraceum DSM 14365]
MNGAGFLLMAVAASLDAAPNAPTRAEVDAELIRRSLAGEDAAFTALYRRHVDRVFGRLTRLIGPVPEREDLVQQIFVDVFRALPSFRGDAAFSTLLYRITARAAYDHLSRRRRSRTASELPGGVDEYDELLADGLAPELRLQARSEIARAFALLAQLKPKKRIAFVLVVIEGMSIAEAAALVGASEPALKQQVRAARRELEALEARHQRMEVVP